MTNRVQKVPSAATHTELSRDVYGFTVRPHHMKLYKEYAVIYEEEEVERSARWEQFLNTYGDSADLTRSVESNADGVVPGSTRKADGHKREKAGSRKFETWGHIRPSLRFVERALQQRFKKKSPAQMNDGSGATVGSATAVEPYRASSPTRYISEGSEDDSDEEFYDVERSDVVQDGMHSSPEASNEVSNHEEEPCPWKEELCALVGGGVPMALRGELWQVFVGSSSRRVQGHYQALLTLLADGGGDGNGSGGLCNHTSPDYKVSDSGILEKWTNQIEKDLPRTFPGHPALGEDGRNALRHLLTAYARHNPNVGYCQAMNFFAGLLLLMMPEENAFWTLTGILDDCFEGYYSEKMLESQVDQLVLEDLVRKHFPRLVTHLDTLGVQVSWLSGPWFLSIFVNILPWESVLRVWDVLLYEGNRSMLFRTTLALMELHGSAIVATKDAGDAVAMLQSLAGATFDSSQLVLTACVGYQFVNESQLQELRLKHRPQVLAMFSEHSIDRSIWHKAYGPISFSSKLYNYNKTEIAPRDQQFASKPVEALSTPPVGDSDHVSAFLKNSETYASSPRKEGASLSSDNAQDGVLDKGTIFVDLVNQVDCLKLELSRALEDRRAANLRAEELETAFMELVKEDNRRLLSAKVETLEAEVAHLKQALADKVEQEQAMVQVMVRMEHEQRLTEDARQFAEEDATRQRGVVNAVQAKYEGVVTALKELEKRTAMAESMLEATLQYQALNNGQVAPSKQPSSSTQREDPSRWSWSWNTSKSIDSDGSIAGITGSYSSSKLDGKDLIHERLDIRREPQHTDSPQSQGLLSRRFSFAWREMVKGKAGGQAEASEHHSGLSPKSLSPQTSLDGSYMSAFHDKEEGET